MGNTLVKPNQEGNIVNDSLLGKEVQRILTEREIPLKKNDDGSIQSVKVNQAKACCLGVMGGENNTDIVSVKIPKVHSSNTADANYSEKCANEGKCMGYEMLGLKVKLPAGQTDAKAYCKNTMKYPVPNFNTEKDAEESMRCNEFMTDQCAKNLYDRGCMKCEPVTEGHSKYDANKSPEDQYCVPIFDTSNPNCLDKDGQLTDGAPECTCLNSMTGYNLNMNPTNEIIGGVAFKNKVQNPYGVEGTSANDYTKYSLDLFGYPETQQYPQVFDSRCVSRINGAKSNTGESRPYLLPKYRKTDVTMCLNSININNSDIGTANLKNIQQQNDCGGLNTDALKKELDCQKVIDRDGKEYKSCADRDTGETWCKSQSNGVNNYNNCEQYFIQESGCKSKVDSKTNNNYTSCKKMYEILNTPPTPEEVCQNEGYTSCAEKECRSKKNPNTGNNYASCEEMFKVINESVPEPVDEENLVTPAEIEEAEIEADKILDEQIEKKRTENEIKEDACKEEGYISCADKIIKQAQEEAEKIKEEAIQAAADAEKKAAEKKAAVEAKASKDSAVTQESKEEEIDYMLIGIIAAILVIIILFLALRKKN